MMKSFPKIFFTLFIATTNFAYGEDKLTVDQIIDHFIEGIGGIQNIKALDNLVYSGGTYQEGDFTGNGNAAMSLGRPYFKLVGNKNKTDRYMEGYDGSAWEYYSGQGVVVRTVGRPSEAIRHYAGVEHPLFKYKEKGSTAELLGRAPFEGNNVLVIKLTRMDGFIEQFYIEPNSYQLIASGADAPIHAFGDSVSQITKISDYRAVANVMIAHRFETVSLPEGNVLSSMQWGNIAANKMLPDDWFSPPVLEMNPLQEFAKKLYQQRTDINSVMWTYKRFRLFNPGLNTSEMVNFAGFQMLKMDHVDNATTLLEQNVNDYPDNSNAHFELGRAYITAQRMEEASIELRMSLKLDPQNTNANRALQTIE